MRLNKTEVAKMIDISAVRADSNEDEIKTIVEAAKKHRFICVFSLPSFTPLAKELLTGESGICLGGVVGFPSGAATTSTKAFEAEELLEIGCQELDMVINIGQLKSRLYRDVAKDIKRIVELAGLFPVKVILEVSLLTDLEIREGAKIIKDSGAQFVKTGTGWAGVTTFDHIRSIKDAVGDSIQLKVAGGVRNLDVLLKMHAMGVSRFGIGHRYAVSIMDEFLHVKNTE
jgi:deoxyribose-phosphate aldolase